MAVGNGGKGTYKGRSGGVGNADAIQGGVSDSVALWE